MTNTGRINLTILAGEGFIVENRGDAFNLLMGMARKGWLGRVSSIKGSGLYLNGTHRLAAFIAYCENNGFTVTTSI